MTLAALLAAAWATSTAKSGATTCISSKRLSMPKKRARSFTADRIGSSRCWGGPIHVEGRSLRLITLSARRRPPPFFLRRNSPRSRSAMDTRPVPLIFHGTHISTDDSLCLSSSLEIFNSGTESCISGFSRSSLRCIFAALTSPRVRTSMSGLVIIVVTRHMTTMMENICVVRTWLSSPMFRTMSSTRPFVFISTPSVMESRHVSPVHLAAIVHPMILPAHAVRITKMVIPAATGLLMESMFVLRPEYVKYNGRKKVTTRSSYFSDSFAAMLSSRGIERPRTKPPKIAWMPILSVNQAQTNSIKNVTRNALMLRWLCSRK
mmetsp:Transcript_26229/g.42963  ORF Transcript_26229/g.42963 Transcript_26229/m.42963 type:complete len:320 (+) Transcript_26229:967-1926(+)